LSGHKDAKNVDQKSLTETGFPREKKNRIRSQPKGSLRNQVWTSTLHGKRKGREIQYSYTPSKNVDSRLRKKKNHFG